MRLLVIISLALVGFNSYAQEFYQTGKASYYASYFEGQKTANGESFSNKKMTAAHRTLPFGTKVLVTNLSNKKSVIVTVNDRGPFVKGRIIDLTQRAARELGFYQQGIAKVSIESVHTRLPNDSLSHPLCPMPAKIILKPDGLESSFPFNLH